MKMEEYLRENKMEYNKDVFEKIEEENEDYD